jgi:dTDP-4-dehydrorhamnose 3,5-epimerase
MFWIPVGFAHGFAVLSETVEFVYKVTAEYNKDSERSVHWNDSQIGIRWPVKHPILSKKDKYNPLLYDLPENERFL